MIAVYFKGKDELDIMIQQPSPPDENQTGKFKSNVPSRNSDEFHRLEEAAKTGEVVFMDIADDWATYFRAVIRRIPGEDNLWEYIMDPDTQRNKKAAGEHFEKDLEEFRKD